MNSAAGAKALVVLVPDADIEAALAGILKRPLAVGIREIKADIYRHPERDPGVCLGAEKFLRPFIRTHRRAMVLFDHRGSGRSRIPPDELQEEVMGRLSQSGWGDRAIAVVLRPELEAWVWANSPHVARVLGWGIQGRERMLRWLREQGFGLGTFGKPDQPKRAMIIALRESRTPRSPRLYAELAQSVSLRACHDPAFERFLGALKEWFPRSSD